MKQTTRRTRPVDRAKPPGSRLRTGCLAASIALFFGGCGSSDAGSPIVAGAAQEALAQAFDRPLVDNVITGPDASVSKIAGSFVGGNEFEHIVAVVFERPGDSRALTGDSDARRIPGPDAVAVIRVANVVVLYSRAQGAIDRRSAFRRALLSVCRGCPKSR